MESISIKGSKRKSLGKADAKALRNEGLVPCIIYGGKENMHVQIDERAFKGIIYTPKKVVVDLDLGDESVKCILKDAQFHPISDKIVHVDFQQLTGRPVKTSLNINITGQSRGVQAGGKLKVVLRSVNVLGMPEELPSIIELDITKLGIGKAIKVGDLKIKGATFLDAADQIIVAVRMKRGAVVEAGDEEEEAATEEVAAEAAAE